MYMTNEVLKNWRIDRTSKHGSRLIYTDDGIFGNVQRIEQIDDTISKSYTCPRGHSFKTNKSNALIISINVLYEN